MSKFERERRSIFNKQLSFYEVALSKIAENRSEEANMSPFVDIDLPSNWKEYVHFLSIL
jgi:hypothetical protein